MTTPTTDPMALLVEYLLETSSDSDPTHGKVVAVQVEFRGFGIASPQGDPNMQAGVLRRTAVKGIFCLSGLMKAQAEGPGFQAGETVMVEHYFAPDDVRRIIRLVPTSGLIMADAPIARTN